MARLPPVVGVIGQIASGGHGVWVIDTSNFIFRFDSSKESFVQVSVRLDGAIVRAQRTTGRVTCERCCAS